MKRFATLLTTLCFVGGIGSAATFTGRLMDADCYNTNKVDTRANGHKTYQSITKTCAATASTTNFAVRITGNKYDEYLGDTIKLNDEGNTQASSEIQNGTLKPRKDGRLHVKVTGKLQGEMFETASVTPRGQ